MNVETAVNDYEVIALENEKRVAFYERLSRECQKRQLHVFPLKGVDLLLRGLRPMGLRPMGDLDVYVPKSDVIEVVSLLREWGFVRKKTVSFTKESFADESADFFSPDGEVWIEVNWGLLLPISEKKLLARSTSIVFRGETYPVLHAADSLLYTIIYTVGHRGRFLPTFIGDIEALLTQFARLDLENWVKDVQRYGVAPVVFHGLSYVKTQSEATDLQNLLDQLTPENSREANVRRFYRERVSEKKTPQASWPLRWRTASLLKKRSALIQRLLWPSRIEAWIRMGRTPAFYEFVWRVVMKGVTSFGAIQRSRE